MSDTRRRRKSNQSSDDLSDSYEELNVTKETQSSEQTDGHQDSECDVYESESDAESQDSGGEQRESGDSQEEEKPQKKLDDNEDRRNPQYVPKRGTFYEHDDRTADEITDNNPETPTNVKETKEKKVWKNKGDRWDHDRYNDEEQAPKKPKELIATYGYDIRNEEGPPRARRYGCGPNKYTRNWKDEDAFGKTGPTPSRGSNRRFQKNNEDFPTLGSSKNTPTKVEEPVISSTWYSNKNKTQNKTQNFPPLQSQQDNTKSKPAAAVSNTSTSESKAPNGSTNTAWKKDGKHLVQNQSANGNNGSGGDAEKLASNKVSPRENNKRNTTQESVSLAARTRGRGFKSDANNNMVANRIVENKSKGRGSGPVSVENRRNNTAQPNDEHQIVHGMKQLSVNDGTQYRQTARHNKGFFTSFNQHRSNAVPPRMQQQQSHQQQTRSQQRTIQQQQDSSGNRPERYSSQRQRTTISKTSGQQNYPSQHGQHGYFPPQGYPQGHFEQSCAVAPATTAMAGQPVISLLPSGQPACYASLPAFLVPPSQFIPPQTVPPGIIYYVPGPNGPTFPPNFQGYQGYNPSVPVRITDVCHELFEYPQGPPPPQEPQECTYYSPAQQQQQQQQTAPMRQPKAAIPILPPPDNQQRSSRGRGRSIQQYQQSNQPGNMQQSEQEVKANAVAGSDEKPVPMRQPKAAIPILPPPDNQQRRSRGRGRSTQQYQQSNQPGNMQQSEQEVKANAVAGSDEKPVPGQFDDVQVEQSKDQESQKSQTSSDTVRTVNVDDSVDKNTDVDTHIMLDASSVKKDNVDDSVSVKELLETASNEKDLMPHNPAILATTETEHELSNIESAITENTIVEKAAA